MMSIATVPELSVSMQTVGAITAALRIDVSADTLFPQWYGESMDLGLAVTGLYGRETPVSRGSLLEKS